MNVTYVLGLVAALVTLGFVIELLRRGVLLEKFAALWLLVSVAIVIMAIFPTTLTWLADLLGVEVPSNLLFLMGGVLLLLVSVQLSHEVSRVEARTRRLAEEIALLRYELNGREGPR